MGVSLGMRAGLAGLAMLGVLVPDPLSGTAQKQYNNALFQTVFMDAGFSLRPGAAFAASQAMYLWKDADGTTHISATPPPQGAGAPRRVRVSGASGAPSVPAGPGALPGAAGLSGADGLPGGDTLSGGTVPDGAARGVGPDNAAVRAQLEAKREELRVQRDTLTRQVYRARSRGDDGRRKRAQNALRTLDASLRALDAELAGTGGQ